eukprot:11564525-Ditylum_brightwellii.AAC.1
MEQPQGKENGSVAIHGNASPTPNNIYGLTATFADGSRCEEAVETPLTMTSLWEIRVKRGNSRSTPHECDDTDHNKTSPSRVGQILAVSDPKRSATAGGIAQLHHGVLSLVVDCWLC